jgi:hypothetical protein
MIRGRTVRLAGAVTVASALAAVGIWAGPPAAVAITAAASAMPASAQPTAGQGQPASTTLPLFAYYYIWFNPSSWGRAKRDLPLIGAYSSSNQGVMRQQIQQAKSVGITGFIVSWKDTPLNDLRLHLLMRVAAAEHFKLAMIYQGLDFSRVPLPVSRVAADFATFRDRFASDPVFFRVNGKPLTIWSGTWAFSYAQIARVTTAVRPTMLVLGTEKSVAGFDRIARLTDGDAYYWSSVNPATYPGYQSKLDEMGQAVHLEGKYWIAPLAPGFDARLIGGHRAVPRDGGATLRTEFTAAVRSAPNMLGLISWNEFTENSYVEPSKYYGDQSLNVLRQLRGIPDRPSSPQPAVRAVLSPWPNVLRLSAFAALLVAVVVLLGAARRRRTRRQPRAASPRTEVDPSVPGRSHAQSALANRNVPADTGAHRGRRDSDGEAGPGGAAGR